LLIPLLLHQLESTTFYKSANSIYRFAASPVPPRGDLEVARCGPSTRDPVVVVLT